MEKNGRYIVSTILSILEFDEKIQTKMWNRYWNEVCASI